MHFAHKDNDILHFLKFYLIIVTNTLLTGILNFIYE